MAYDNPAGLIAAAVILWVVAVACVGGRFLARRKLRAPIIVSDWIILVSLVCATGLSAMEIYGVAVHALGYPLSATIEDPKAVDGRLNKAKHIELSYLLLGIFTLGLIKISVCLFYWHIFDRPIFRRLLMVWIAVILTWTSGFVLAGLLECGSHLLALFGTPQQYLEKCGSAIPSGWAMVGSDVATDAITIAIPIPMIWSLQMPTTRKILVAAVFMTGLLSLGASIAKAYIYISATRGLYEADAITILTGLSVWNLVEVEIGIVAACGPTLRPILAAMVPTESLLSLLNSLTRQLSSGSSTKQSKSEATDTPPYSSMGSEEQIMQHEKGAQTRLSGDNMA